MQELDRSFDPARFLAGADQAFRMIVAAFAAGDRVALRPLLGDATYSAFEQAISARETAGETQVSQIKSMHNLSIEDAEVKGQVGSITARIVSDQISYTTDRNGKPLTGADAVTEITDLWTFERDLSQQDPTWRLVAARSG
jgi:predicted lipid-binding transport protein (Tim44 family)